LVCDEHGIGGGGEYCGDNDAQLDRINVFYYGASGGKRVPNALLFDLRYVRVILVNQNAGADNDWAKAHCTVAGNELS
jgi:tubulin beta